MKLTRVIAVTMILASTAFSALNAQTLRKAAPPAEFPPTSYKGKQYVDSRGCIYIRAGIDGNIIWVPRVSRSRKQICGYKPTAVAESRPATPPKPVRAPVIITANPPAGSVVNPAVPAAKPRQSAPVATQPAPAVVAARPEPPQIATPGAPKPSAARPAQRRTPSAAPAPTVFTTPAPTPAAKPEARVATTANPATTIPRRPSPAPTVFNAPQPKPASKPAPVRRNQKRSVAELPAGTRVVPRHVHDNRQNTTNVAVPKGYRPVWSDGRLNQHRAETNFQTAQVRGVVTVPPGFKRAEWQDRRLNRRRGPQTVRGDAQMGQIWTNTVPRTLVRVPTQGRIVVIPARTAVIQDPQTVVTRVSTRSAPAAPTPAPVSTRKRSKGIYVQVESYSATTQARAVARALAGTGLPTRLGTTRSGGVSIVLAGPFTSKATARAALKQVRSAGYLNARMGR